jgi:hypothetical protein
MLFALMEINRRSDMANVHYRIVAHDGWAYKAADVFSKCYATHEEARGAAERAAAEQRLPGATEDIEYQRYISDRPTLPIRPL